MNDANEAPRKRQAEDFNALGLLFTQPAALLLVGFLGLAGPFFVSFFIEKPLNEYPRLGVVLAAALILMLVYDYIILSASAPKGTKARQRFNHLRDGLSGRMSSPDLYNRAVVRFLGIINRLFNDAGTPARRGWLHERASLVATPHLWTARAFDRSLFYAFLYPVMALLLIWAATGAIDPLASALRFEPNAPVSLRWIGAASAGWVAYCAARFLQGEGFNWRWLLATAIGVAVPWGVARLGAGLGATLATNLVICTVVFSGIVTNWVTGASIVTGSVALTVILLGIFAVAGQFEFTVAGAFAFAVALLVLMPQAERTGKTGWAMLFVFLMLGGMVLATPTILPLSGLSNIYPILLLLGLFTLINAVFDWFALGVTRLLLHKGQEKGGYAPILYGLLDIFISLALLALLAYALVAGTMVMEAIMHSVAAKPSPRLIDELAMLGDPARAALPENWWIFVMLLATQIFSVINVALALLTVLRGLPWINDFVHTQLSDSSASSVGNRMACCTILSLQTTAALTFAVAFYWWAFKAFIGSYGTMGGWLLNGLTAFAKSAWL